MLAASNTFAASPITASLWQQTHFATRRAVMVKFTGHACASQFVSDILFAAEVPFSIKTMLGHGEAMELGDWLKVASPTPSRSSSRPASPALSRKEFSSHEAAVVPPSPVTSRGRTGMPAHQKTPTINVIPSGNDSMQQLTPASLASIAANQSHLSLL